MLDFDMQRQSDFPKNSPQTFPPLTGSLAMLLRIFLLTVTAAIAQNADPFAEGVRTTEPLPPAEQRAKFKLPPGFEIQLVAAETDLRKPMNMAFDALGRLWITESREYPMPAKDPTQARDTVRIYSDFDANGRARKVQIFADGLNIPIGIYPFNSPASNGEKKNTWKCIVWSIPNIWLGRTDVLRKRVGGAQSLSRQEEADEESQRQAGSNMFHAMGITIGMKLLPPSGNLRNAGEPAGGDLM